MSLVGTGHRMDACNTVLDSQFMETFVLITSASPVLKVKRKRCKHCRDLFSPRSSFQVVCSPGCAVEYCKTQASVEHRKSVERRETREARKRVKSKAQWRKEAQQAFNAYIRDRDKADPCISCGRPATWQGQWHASHFKSVGAHGSLRFNEDNCAKSCSICNNHLSGNIGEYRPRLIEKIGLERVEKLEGPQELTKYTIEDYQRIKARYKQKLRDLQA